MSTAPGVCVLGWVKCREHISLLVILCIMVYVTNNNKKHNKYKNNIYIYIIYIYTNIYLFFQNRYPIMVKCLNIGKPIYRSISSFNTIELDVMVKVSFCLESL